MHKVAIVARCNVISVIQFTISVMLVALVVVLSADAAEARNFGGNNKANTIKGTKKADTIKGFGGNDKLLGIEGNDVLQGGDGNDDLRGGSGNDTVKGGDGRDRIYGNTGADEFVGGNGDDAIFARGKGIDTIYCGNGFDEASVSVDDLIGGQTVDDILSNVTMADQDALSCEVLILEGLRIPLGALANPPTEFEAEVSRAIEDILRSLESGDPDAGELADVQRLLDRIANAIDEGDEGLLEDLLDELNSLLDIILG